MVFSVIELMFEDTMLNVRMWSNLKNFKETFQKNHDPCLNWLKKLTQW